MCIYMIVEQILMIHLPLRCTSSKVILNKNIYKIWMLYSLSILALKKEKERNSKSINHMGQWHTAFRLHELNFSVVGIIYRIGPQEYPLLVLQSDYKIAKSEFLCHSRCGMKEIPQWPKDITVLTSWHIKSNILTSNMYAIFSDIMQNINKSDHLLLFDCHRCGMWQLCISETVGPVFISYVC